MKSYLMMIIKNKNKLMEDTCKWKLYDDGMMGIPDMEYRTECGREHIDADSDIVHGDYCSFCGKRKKFI